MSFGGGAIKCATCDKTVYPAEKQVYGKNTYHKGCFKCTDCGVRLTMTNCKAEEGSGKLYCERDWNQGGHGTVGVKSTETAESMRCQIAKKAENVRRDANSGIGTNEVRGINAGQASNIQDEQSLNVKHAAHAPRSQVHTVRGIDGTQDPTVDAGVREK